MVRRVGLGGFGDRYPHQLSGGMRKRVAMAQTLILDPDIILMDEPFSALDIQTRQLMENELLALWPANRKAVLFITHDLDEAIAMSDRVVVLSAGPGTRPIGEFTIDLPRPRDVAEIRSHPRFVELHAQIWGVLREEVLKGYQQSSRRLNRGRMTIMWNKLRPNRANLVLWQWLLLVLCFLLWYVLTSPTLLPAFYFDDSNKAAFFFGEPQKVLLRIWDWFPTGEIYLHLWVTLIETVLAFAIGTVPGSASACGSRLRRSTARSSIRTSRPPTRCRA